MPYPKDVKILGGLHELVKRSLQIDISRLETKATGIREGKRLYGSVVLLAIRDSKGNCFNVPPRTLNRIQEAVTSQDEEAARVLLCLTDKPRKEPWAVAIRAIESKDFVKATVSKVPWGVLRKIEEKITGSCPTVGAVFFDITPKPPSSIEFE